MHGTSRRDAWVGVGEEGSRRRGPIRGAALAIAVMVGVTATVAASPAQSTLGRVGTDQSEAARVDTDPRWLPWLGCWREATGSSVRGGVPDDMRVCVTPAAADTAGAGGVLMTTRSGSQVLIEELVTADGAERALEEAQTGCTGWRVAEWSNDGLRVFTRAELSCQEQPLRAVTGLMLMGPGGEWVDVQHVESDEDVGVRVRRYRRTVAQPVGTAGPTPETAARAAARAATSSAGRLSIEDVIEAADRTSSPAVEAALVETGSQFDLGTDELLALDEAGVDESLIDAMVALSYPDQFQVERGFSSGGSRAVGDWGGGYLYDPFWAGTYYPYYYYSPFGYSYWGRYGFGTPYYLTAPYYAVPSYRRDPSRRGTVVAGRGYTRIRPRGDGGSSSSAPGAGGGGSGGRARGGVSPRGATQGGSTDSSGGSSSSSGGSSAGSSGGAGSSSGGSGRTAQPR